MTDAGAQAPLLSVKGLNAWYGESHILHGVDLEVRAGEVVTLLGRNGVGKTTTLKSIMGMVGRREGSITSEGRETIALPSQQIGRTLARLKQEGFTILLVEQNFRFAQAVADRHYVMENGRVVDMIPNAGLEASMAKLHDYLGV